jgi:hypothetical protein
MQDEFYNKTRLVAASATQNIGGNFADFYDSYVNAQGEDEFYNGLGDFVDNFKKRRAKRVKERQKRRRMKAEGKLIQAKAGLEAAKSMTASAKSDAALAKALKDDSPKEPKKNKMIIPIVVGSLLVVGVLAFVLLRKK